MPGYAEPAPRAILLGFPSDEGVRRNGGRVGAAGGPDALRTAFYRLVPDARSPRFGELLRHTRDLGDLEVSGDVESDQRNLGEAIAPYLDSGTFVVVLGGGHETSYGHFLGYTRGGQRVEIINWDAHADVRELKEGKAHSGRLSGRRSKTHRVAAGATLSPGCGRTWWREAHLEFVKQHGTAVWREEVVPETIEALYRGGVQPDAGLLRPGCRGSGRSAGRQCAERSRSHQRAVAVGRVPCRPLWRGDIG